VRFAIALGVTLTTVGCAASAPSRADEPGAASAEAPADKASTLSAPATSEESAGAAGGKADAGAAGAPTPFEVCGQMCDRMRQRCSESAVKTCRRNCKNYQSPPEGCQDAARAALECARDAEDLECVIIAPTSCNPAFLRFAACARGEKVEAKAEPTAVPSGWERFSSKRAGFAVVVPRGVTETKQGDDPVFKVEDGSVTYSVRVRKGPEQRPTQKSFVKVALDLLGPNCSKGLRLHGMIEQSQAVSIRFESQCTDGTEWRGQFVVAHGKLYVLALTGPKGFKGEESTFFSSFEAT
jgi:hypothetical protein